MKLAAKLAAAVSVALALTTATVAMADSRHERDDRWSQPGPRDGRDNRGPTPRFDNSRGDPRGDDRRDDRGRGDDRRNDNGGDRGRWDDSRGRGDHGRWNDSRGRDDHDRWDDSRGRRDHDRWDDRRSRHDHDRWDDRRWRDHGRHGYGAYWHRHRGPYVRPYGYASRHWYRGQRLPAWYCESRYVIHDHYAYRLREPPRGYRWVRVDGDAILAAIATGIVLEVVYGYFG